MIKVLTVLKSLELAYNYSQSTQKCWPSLIGKEESIRYKQEQNSLWHAHDILVSIECCRMLYIPQRLCFCVINACSMKPSWTTKNFHPAWCYLSCTTLYMVVHSKDVEAFQLTLGWSATFDSLAVDLWDDSTLVQAFCWMKVFASFIGALYIV